MRKAPRIPGFLLEIQPCVPEIPHPESARESGVPIVHLGLNENPLGPSPLAVEAAHRAMSKANCYPDAAASVLRRRLAEHLGMPMEYLVFGNGATELILLAGHASLMEGDEGVASEGTFPMYSIAIRSAGARLVTAPLRHVAVDLDALAGAITPRTRIVYIANPNNPTGTCFSASAFESFLDRVPEELVVVLDEAYYEYAAGADFPRSLDLVRQGRNVIVLRTFSKVYGLAGLRIGYGIAKPEIVAAFDRVRDPFNTSNVAQAAALAALGDLEHVRQSLKTNRDGLAQLAHGLEGIGVKFVPSVANFLLVEVAVGGQAVADGLLRAGVLVRPMAGMGFPQAIRVTVGTAEQNRLFLAALAGVLGALRDARLSH